MDKKSGKKALFLDRDGVICAALPHGEDVTSCENFIINPKIKSVLSVAKEKGYIVVVVTNQSAIGLGKLSTDDLEMIHSHMMQLLDNMIDAIYFCPHTPQDNCDCRKPNTGMFLRAKEELGIDLVNSITVGDRETDIKAGQSVGTRTMFLMNDIHGYRLSKCDIPPDLASKNIDDLLGLI